MVLPGKDVAPPSAVVEGGSRTLGWPSRVWRFYRSLPFGLLLLSLIAVCLIRASLIAADPVLGQEAIHEAKNRVYGTWWFQGLLLFFGVQFVISTWHVTVMSFGIPGKRVFWRSRRAFDRMEYGAVIERGSAECKAIEKAVARHCTLFHRDGDSVYGHRGLLSRLGPTGVHAGIVTILVAGLLWAYLDRSGRILTEGRWMAMEGETSQSLVVPEDRTHALGPGNQRAAPIRAQIRLLDFDVVNHPHSESPAEFSSVIEIREPDRPGIRVARVDMNTPCRIDGLLYHQAAYIPVARVARAQFDVRQASSGRRIAVVDSGAWCPVTVDGTDLILEVSSAKPGAAWALSQRSAPGRPVAWGVVSENAPTETLERGRGNSEEAAFSEALASTGVLPPTSSMMARLEGERQAKPEDFEVRYLEPAQGYATVLSVITVNPAIPLIWFGVGTVFVFALVTFGFRYRQAYGLWDDEGTVLHLALLPHRSHYPLQKKFQAMLDSIRAAGGRVIEARMPSLEQEVGESQQEEPASRFAERAEA